MVLTCKKDARLYRLFKQLDAEFTATPAVYKWNTFKNSAKTRPTRSSMKLRKRAPLQSFTAVSKDDVDAKRHSEEYDEWLSSPISTRPSNKKQIEAPLTTRSGEYYIDYETVSEEERRWAKYGITQEELEEIARRVMRLDELNEKKVAVAKVTEHRSNKKRAAPNQLLCHEVLGSDSDWEMSD